MMLRYLLAILVLLAVAPLETWTFSGNSLPSNSQQRRFLYTNPAPSSRHRCFGIVNQKLEPWSFRTFTTTAIAAKGDDDDDFDDSWEPDENELLNGMEDLEDMDAEDDDGSGLDGFQAADDSEEDDEDEIFYSDDEDEEEIEEDTSEYIWEEDDVEVEEEDVLEEEEAETADDDEEWEYVYEDDLDKQYIFDPENGLDEEFFDDEYAKVPLRDYPEDPNYGETVKKIEETAQRREEEGGHEDFDPIDYLCNDMTEEEAKMFDKTELQQQTEKEAAPFMTLGPQDVQNLDLSKELSKITDLYDDDPYIPSGETNYLGTGVTDDDMKDMDDAWKSVNEALEREPWNKVDIREGTWNSSLIDNTTLFEMSQAIQYIEGSSYDYPKWLKYDLDFNVTNLMLASVKHNPDAPVFLMHWYAQLLFYTKYQHARDINFEFSHEDVENADIEELERYYLGFGYDEIPNKQPEDTGIIAVEEMDEEEVKMAGFETWIKDVYNPEWDKLDLDDEDMKDENNVFSPNFIMPTHPDLPSFEDAEADMEAYNETMGEDLDAEYRDFYGKKITYQPSGENGGFIEDFRGHLVIACGPITEDINTAEKITARIVEEFGEQVYPETRIIKHVISEDNVFEVWLESYEVDLLHSRRRNFMQTYGWDGPANVDDAQLDWLINEIRDLTSDDARICHRYEEFGLIE